MMIPCDEFNILMDIYDFFQRLAYTLAWGYIREGGGF